MLFILSNQYDTEDLALAASFALGDKDVVERVIHSFPKQKLGIGLTKFTPQSIMHIIKVLESFEGPNIGHKTLSMFISSGVYSSDFSDQAEAKLRFLKSDYHYSQNIQSWGEKFGIHVMHESWIQSQSQPRELLTKGNRSSSSKKMMRFRFDKSMHKKSRGKGGIVLSNFRCTFESPVVYVSEDTVEYNFQSIHLIGPRKQHNRCSADVDAIATTFAEKIVWGVAQAAAKRLRKLVAKVAYMRQGALPAISHEHIAIASGNSSDVLQKIRDHDMNMILTHNEKIAATLHSTLQYSVPLPDQCDVEEGKTPSAHLDREINTFVESYTKLVNLSYCEVPLLMGKPPSSFVPDESVNCEALSHKDCFWTGRSLMVHATRRKHEKEEKERLIRYHAALNISTEL